MPVLNDIHSIIVPADSANFLEHNYTEIYAAADTSVVINGETVVMGGNSSIKIKIHSISGGADCLLLGENINNTYDNPIINPSTDSSTDPALRLLFDDIINVPVASAASVSDWNTFFDLPTNGTPFTSVVVNGNEVRLFGGAGITLADQLFDQPDLAGTHLIEVHDDAGCVIAGGYDSFGADNNSGCPNLTTAIFPAMVTTGDICFSTNGSSLVTVYFPVLTTAGGGCFQYCPFINPNFPMLSSILGGGVFSDCLNITDSFSILSTITDVGNNCFYNCTGLINPNFSSLQNSANSSFGNCTSLVNPNLQPQKSWNSIHI